MKNKLSKLLIIILIPSLTVTGCFWAKIVPENIHECKLVTKKFTLVFSEKDGTDILQGTLSDHCEGDARACLLAFTVAIVAIPASSFIVSGSIVVIGNTINWIEQQGRCKDSSIRTAINNLIESTKTIGGISIQSGKKIIKWFKKHLHAEF